MTFNVQNRCSAADDHGGDNNVNDAATWRQLTEPEVIRPFCLIVWYFFFTNLMSGIPFSPYLVTVFTEFNVPVAVEWTIVSVPSKEEGRSSFIVLLPYCRRLGNFVDR